MTFQAPLTLAVVDDDPDVRTALSRLLRSMGHNVRVFASAEEFDPNESAFDCLILDLRLPGMSGLELSHRLSLRESKLPLVLITGDCDPLSREGRESSHEISELLNKPFGADALMRAIANAIAAAGHFGEVRVPAESARG